MRRSAVIVELPFVEVLSDVRQQYARDARWGVGAHITVLFPFVSADDISAAVSSRLEAVIADISAFTYALTATRWFGDSVLWLAPDDPAPWVQLSRAVTDAFPGHAAYGGAHGEIIPHATVGDVASLDELRRAEERISTVLPIRGVAAEVVLLVETDDGLWQRFGRFPLGPPAVGPV